MTNSKLQLCSSLLLSVWLGTLKGSNMCLHSYTFVFSLQETKEDMTFDSLLKPDGTHCSINQEEFEGFSFINYGVRQ